MMRKKKVELVRSEDVVFKKKKMIDVVCVM
jgi:hypothetical protein